MDQKKRIRILLVDDSFFMRKLLADIISQETDLQVVGQAKDGAIALDEALRLKPDVIVMDYNMPNVNGAEATSQILDSDLDPKPAIVMLSAFTKEGAVETLRSLRAGAVDFITKPSGELSLDIDKIKDQLLEKIRLASRAHVRLLHSKKHQKPKEKDKVKAKLKDYASKIVIIGSSTGGPPVVEDIISDMPADLGATIVIVQHMPQFFIEKFAKRLDKLSPLVVKEAEEGDELKNGLALIMPSNFYLSVLELNGQEGTARVVKLMTDPDEHGCHPSIDKTMDSMASFYQNQVIGIILTGMSDDGKIGMQSIKAVGGQTIVQDPKTAVIDSMPRAIIDAHLADDILSPEQIAKKIIALCSG